MSPHPPTSVSPGSHHSPLSQCAVWVSLLVPAYHSRPHSSPPVRCRMPTGSLERHEEQGVSPIITGWGKQAVMEELSTGLNPPQSKASSSVHLLTVQPSTYFMSFMPHLRSRPLFFPFYE